ncbi:hypothetical protein N7499_003134 [Penicillium canescens]|uniref:Uncharacterized protein n=1 Tax=Penicillium canescens TaxID=5083 RepID=A0AAD6IAI4_PENCN|nr:uncharacterized protein N7446_012003 [Penicillium canescens]KAJ6019771.1 hypothetical protein N7522_000479 [Penicillium canescens]KAJ6039057.1 hypothetical protein N7460_007089 [Penicillium canescens]KAJ6047169.1 hypothetical protein N7446_012003 [Penicillium canescens]KAJ6060061.1 hypothetical protein N7444_002807 [Penicillium canescens]KAJ6093803.1 hypothetical protein N7499_003134 [Penicillium canescens]
MTSSGTNPNAICYPDRQHNQRGDLRNCLQEGLIDPVPDPTRTSYPGLAVVLLFEEQRFAAVEGTLDD